jgi:5-methylcytosine-specific restriction protein A
LERINLVMPSKPPQKQYAKVGQQYSRGAVGNFYSSAAWIKLRNYKRLINPICEHCIKVNLITPFHTIDHIKPISEGGEPLDLNNLQTLCRQCHAIKTGKETAKRKNI